MWPFSRHRREDPAFYLQVRYDGECAEGTLRRLRMHYPDARVILVTDGDHHPAHRDLAARHRAEFVQGEWLYGVRSGGAMIERMLELFLKGKGTHLVKLDTDTRIDRRFSSLPNTEGVFGMIIEEGPVQGGCVIIPRTTARSLLTSGVFGDAALRSADTWGKPFPETMLRNRLRTTGMIGFEWVLYWGCRKTGIPTRRWREIHATWKIGVVNADRRFAAVHPDKFTAVTDPGIHDQAVLTHAAVCGPLMEAMYTFES